MVVATYSDGTTKNFDEAVPIRRLRVNNPEEGPVIRICKLPVEVTAWQYLGQAPYSIPTLEGEMLVSPGDYVITGVKGEHYPCKPDILWATYKFVSLEG